METYTATIDEADFDFDSDERIVSKKTPSVKPINKDIKAEVNGKPIEAGLWIASENAASCKWVKTCQPKCAKDCDQHYKSLLPHSIQTNREDEQKATILIPGFVIVHPGMLILHRSNLLQIDKTGRVIREWVKGTEKSEQYYCGRRYLLLFVDEDCNPLHQEPLQLTAKGYFQITYDQHYTGGIDFDTKQQVTGCIEKMNQLHNSRMKTNSNRRDAMWNAMNVYRPIFQSIFKSAKNKPTNKQKACITTGFKAPQDDSLAEWNKYSIGYRKDPASQFWPDAQPGQTYCAYVIYNIYKPTYEVCKRKGWWRKGPYVPAEAAEEPTPTSITIDGE